MVSFTAVGLDLSLVPSDGSVKGRGFSRVKPFGTGGFLDLDCFFGGDAVLVVATGFVGGWAVLGV